MLGQEGRRGLSAFQFELVPGCRWCKCFLKDVGLGLGLQILSGLSAFHSEISITIRNAGISIISVGSCRALSVFFSMVPMSVLVTPWCIARPVMRPVRFTTSHFLPVQVGKLIGVISTTEVPIAGLLILTKLLFLMSLYLKFFSFKGLQSAYFVPAVLHYQFGL